MKYRLKIAWTKWFGLIIGLLLGLLVLPGVSYAHLVAMLSSFPENGAIIAEAPGVITAVYDEELQTETSNLQVFDADGNQVDNKDSGLDLNDPNHASMQVSVPSLSEGEYTVRWHVVVLDGDATAGAFNFFVGDQMSASAANFVPIPDGSEVETTAVPSAGPNNTLWLVAGIVVTAVFVGGAFFLFSRRNSTP